MKIIQIMPEFGLAGAEIMCENLTYELRKLGHDVIVISMYDYHSPITDRLEKEGMDVRYLQKKTGIDISMIFKMRKIFKETKADAIHTHRYCAQYAMPAAILAGVKHRVHTVHNVAQKENGRLARKLNKFFFKHFRLVPVALSESIRDTIAEEYGIEKNKIPVILNGIDLSKCIPKDDYTVNGNFKILHIGRFSEQKNHSGLLQSFKLFHDKHSDSELWLIGEGEKKLEIEEFVNENNLASCVKFFGLQSNVHGYLHDADIFTLPSNYEGMPMTLIEAMGTGLPIAATAVGGVPDILTKGENALLVENELYSISNAFEQYYSDNSLRILHGRKVKERAEVFSATAMALRYGSIYLHELDIRSYCLVAKLIGWRNGK